MGRKKKEETKLDFGFKKLKEETTAWITAIILFAFSIFFILAAFDKAGFVGQKVFNIFTKLFGLGYYLLPAVCLILGVAFAKAIERSFSRTKFIGASLFFISSLALLDFTFSQFGRLEEGGFVGNILQKPLVKLFDIYATPIILGSLMIISILVIFDASLNFSSLFNIFKKNKNEDEPETILTPEKEVKVFINGKYRLTNF